MSALDLPFLLQTAVVTRVLFLVPFEARRKYARLVAELRTDARARLRFYRRFLISWWTVAAIVALSVSSGPDTPEQLGLRPPSSLLALLPLAAWMGLLAIPVVRARSPGPYREAIRAELARVPALLPATRQERWAFAAVSITAGVCEELVFRGLVPLYFARLLPGVPLVGFVVSVVGFGLAHAYQGTRGIVVGTLLGLIFQIAALATGTVSAAMLLHATNDLRFLALVWALGPPPERVNEPGNSS